MLIFWCEIIYLKDSIYRYIKMKCIINHDNIIVKNEHSEFIYYLIFN